MAQATMYVPLGSYLRLTSNPYKISSRIFGGRLSCIPAPAPSVFGLVSDTVVGAQAARIPASLKAPLSQTQCGLRPTWKIGSVRLGLTGVGTPRGTS